ncbi:dual specificity protein phosphatase 12 isoform X2 [Asparagus officinalis]|uniref:dual specificity protein phosphatase 12 isoform X2 n=1 Tax=Asparagus officinalis TaxID=4686 RepID=UPI00098E1DAF|nr:dual specificity protein phosphatase 12 isoform X2 [Asparagus officinalis]
MPFLVREGLFFGNITDAAQTLTSPSNSSGITHILSLLSSASISFFSDWKPDIKIPTEEIKKVYVGEIDGEGKRSLSPEKLFYSLEMAGVDLKLKRMAVPLRDTEDEDLLDYLDICLDFIDEGRKEGGVLVHCFAGVSRSAAIVTAYLMRTEKKSQEGHSYKQGEKVDSSIFEKDPGLRPESNAAEVTTKMEKPNTVYRCKKCRRIVAMPENVVSHTAGEGESSFGWQKRKSGNPYNRYGEVECTSMFVEPLKWMTTVEEGALEGKLTCVKCDARLGYFNWAGIQCSCGSWITPAFQIHKNKVDISKELP